MEDYKSSAVEFAGHTDIDTLRPRCPPRPRVVMVVLAVAVARGEREIKVSVQLFSDTHRKNEGHLI